MRPTDTDRVAWSVVVCLSVCHSSEPCKNGSTDRDAVYARTRVDPRNYVVDGGSDLSTGRGNYKGKGAARCKI